MSRVRHRTGNPEPSQSLASWIGVPTSDDLVRYVAMLTGGQGRVVHEGGVNVVLVPVDMVPRIEVTLQIVHPRAKVRADVPRNVEAK